MNAPTLFEWRSTDPTTSIAAAPTAKKRNRWQLEVLHLLTTFEPPLNAWQVWGYLSGRHERCPKENSVSKRLSDLHALGQVEPRGTRKGGSGKQQTVWAITDAGRARLAVEW